MITHQTSPDGVDLRTAGERRAAVSQNFETVHPGLPDGRQLKHGQAAVIGQRRRVVWQAERRRAFQCQQRVALWDTIAIDRYTNGRRGPCDAHHLARERYCVQR